MQILFDGHPCCRTHTYGKGEDAFFVHQFFCNSLGPGSHISVISEKIFDLPTRLGKPRGISGLVDVVNNPMYATGVGLVLYGAKNKTMDKFRIRDNNIFNRIIGRMKKWFKDVV